MLHFRHFCKRDTVRPNSKYFNYNFLIIKKNLYALITKKSHIPSKNKIFLQSHGQKLTLY